MESNNNMDEWVSASELAKRLGVSTQTIYNRAKKHRYETMVFKRGVMNGILLRVPKKKDE